MGEHGKRFPCFPILAWLCMDVAYAQYMLESQSRCVRNFYVVGDFGPVFCRGQSRIFQVERRLRWAYSLLWGLQLSTQAKNRVETSPSLWEDSEGRAKPGREIHVLTNAVQEKICLNRNYLQYLWGRKNMVGKYNFWNNQEYTKTVHEYFN